MKERILLTYPRRHEVPSRPLVQAVREAIAAEGFDVVEPPNDQTNGAKLRGYLRTIRAVVALYIPVQPANKQPFQKTSSWPEAAVDAARAGVGAPIDCIVITQLGIDDFGLAKADNCIITVPYDPQDASTLSSITEKLKTRLARLSAKPQNCLIWVLNFDLAGFTARVASDGTTVPALTEDQVARAVNAKRSVASVVYNADVLPDHVIDTGDGSYFVYEGSNGADGSFMLELAKRVRGTFAPASTVHIALAAGQATKCYSMSGGLTYLGYPMNVAARINVAGDGGIHVDENFYNVCVGTRAAAELSQLPIQSLDPPAKHGQVFRYRAVPVAEK